MLWGNASYDTFGCSWISNTLFWGRIWHGSSNNCIYFRKGLAGDLVLDYVCNSPWFMLPSNLASLVSSCEGKARFKKIPVLAVSRYPCDNRRIFGSLDKSLAFRIFIFAEYLLIC